MRQNQRYEQFQLAGQAVEVTFLAKQLLAAKKSGDYIDSRMVNFCISRIESTLFGISLHNLTEDFDGDEYTRSYILNLDKILESVKNI